MLQILKQNQKHFSMYAVLILIFAVFGFLTDFVNFMPRNITNLVIQNSYILILAIGMVMVIIIGKIDLSVGSVVALTGAIAAWAYNLAGGSLIVALLVSLFAGALIGAFQGYWIAYLKVPAFIVTLAGMLGWRGATYLFTDLQPIGLTNDSFKVITTGFVEPGFIDAKLLALLVGIAVVVLMVLFDLRRRQKRTKLGFDILPMPLFALKNLFISAVIMWVFYKFSMDRGVPIIIVIIGALVVFLTYVMNNTVFGRNIYAIGGNAKAAKLSGINAERTELYVFTIMGVLAAFAGVIFTAYMNQATPAAGNMFELDAISAVFVGGASATGGVGTIIGSIIGGLVMGVINNGMSLMNLGPEFQYVVKGLVLLVAVWYDLYNNKKSS
ncbi:monosaccharide-transporting ATPase [Formosimonas limnophila]|uniref:Xylose transport system permease protein XylH n=1 Tax=Formosimonas limnophila TaxID=1384487 RepID=A0A8J3CMH9_9BURK|nr:multiple monosaccharide ABC transporter permease [Formosimonas limnophila]GHA70542.1 monosaccharide-transporting ATPase [Formosimonas limnophila]